MKRRFFHVMFWMGSLACSFVIAGSMMALSPSRSLPDVLGVWDGFYLAADGTAGRIDTNFTQVDFRRLSGDGTLYDLGNEDVSYTLRATMARPDFIVGTGETKTGRLTYQAVLKTYAGRGGDAGVLSPQYHLIPSRGGESVSALLLHPFSGVATPDISGSGRGTFASLPDPTIPGDLADPNFRGVNRVEISSVNARGSFAGRVEFSLEPNQSPLISWPLLATASDDGRIIMVSQGAVGKITYDGVLVPAPDSESDDFVWGFFRLQFNDGQSFFGAINFNLSRNVIK